VQFSSDEDPVELEYLPLGHCRHSVLPVALENVPAGHVLQKDEPATPANVPGSHLLQMVDATFLV
jgi:hypothetical protein